MIRNLTLLSVFALSLFAAPKAANVNVVKMPECGNNCPFVVKMPECGNNCPFVVKMPECGNNCPFVN